MPKFSRKPMRGYTKGKKPVAPSTGKSIITKVVDKVKSEVKSAGKVIQDMKAGYKPAIRRRKRSFGNPLKK